MGDRKTLLALAARVEQAQGPDRKLDAEIHCAIRGYIMHEDSDPSIGSFAFWTGAPWHSLCINCSSWSEITASLDAALTLVPEGWRWSVDFTQRAPYRDCGRVDLYAPGDGLTPPDVSDVYAATPALALCAAALRARAEDGNDG